MNRRGDGNVGRFVASALALIGVAVAVPLLLVQASTARFGSASPLGGVDPPWSWDSGVIGDALRKPLGDDALVDLLLRACLCAVWIAVAVIVVNTFAEIVHQVRHRGVPLPSMRRLGWSQGIARFIAVGLLIVLPITSAKPSLAEARGSSLAVSITGASLVVDGGALDRRPGGPDRVIQSIAPATQIAPGSHPDAAASYTVQRGDSVFSIAGTFADHDEQRTLDIANQILDLNLDTTMPDGQRFSNPAYIEPGWVLRLPAGFSAPAAVPVALPSQLRGVDSAPEADAAAHDVHVVVPGDTLWDIAEEQYGSGTSWPRIWEENAGDDMGGGRTFDDPDLILPGWQLELPDDESDAISPSSADMSATDVSAPPLEAAPPPLEAAPPPLEAAHNEAPVEPSTRPTSLPITSTSTGNTSSTTTVVPGTGDISSRDEPPGRTSAPDAPSPIRLEHAAMLAAGILMLVGVRRRQRLRAATPRSRVPEPRPDVVDTELLLRRIDPGERAARIDVACRSAAFALVDTEVQIVVVQVSPDGEIDLTLSGDAIAPPPWNGTGNVWHLAAGVPIELLVESARRVGMPCVAFAQLGIDDTGSDVLVDLEACGTLAIDAQPTQGDAVVRGIAAGLATSMYAEVAHLITVSMPREVLLGHRNAHQADSVDAAFDLAASLVGSTSQNERSSFELRSLRTGGEMWEPAIVLMVDHDAVEHADGVQFPSPGHGVTVVAVVGPNGVPDAPARLTAESDEWTLTVAGRSIGMTPVGLDRADVDRMLAILHDAEQPLIWMDDATPEVDVDERGPIDRPAHPEAVAVAEEPATPVDDFEPMDHAIVVTLLGGVTVRSADGATATWERSKTVELIAWLATHRAHSTRAAARTALWELDVRDATFANVVSEARRGLGRLVKPDDGEEWLARTLTEQLPLHPLVVTDAQLVEERLAQARLQPPAQAIATLRPAVEMVTGMPFVGSSYLWPDAEGITSNLVLLAISACAELAGHALSVGDIDLVFSATAHGLAVLPGHEELIALRMRAYARSGDLAGVRQEWENYERVIVADAWSDGEPAPKLVALRRELLTTSGDAQPPTC